MYFHFSNVSKIFIFKKYEPSESYLMKELIIFELWMDEVNFDFCGLLICKPKGGVSTKESLNVFVTTRHHTRK